MTAILIDDTLPYTQSIAAAAQTVFNTNWTVDDITDVVVYARATGVDANDVTQIVNPINYTVTLIGSEEYVRVTFGSGRTASDVITITRNTPADRMNIYTNTNFTPSMLNGDFGRQVMMIQQNLLHWSQLMPRYNTSATVQPVIDMIFPILPAKHTWRKNSGDTAIEIYELPDGGIAPADATYLTLTDESADLPNSFNLEAIGLGVMINKSTDNTVLVRTLTGTTSQIDIANGTGIGGNPTFSIASNPVLSGTAGMGIPQGTTAQRVTPSSGIGLRFNTDLQQLEYYDGGWVQLSDSSIPFLPLAGGTMSGVINMGNNFITNVTDPVNPQDAATKSFVENFGSGTVSAGLINQIAFYPANGTTVDGLATANDGVLVTSGAGVPSISTTLPSGLTIPGYQTTITGAALTKSDDTNVTLTLGGTPASALLAATSLTLGWTGTLGIARGGTGLGTTPTAGQLLIGNGTNYTLATLTGGTNITIDNSTPGAITINASGGGGTVTEQDIQDQAFVSAIDAGVQDAAVFALTPPITVYADFQRFSGYMNYDNTGAFTVDYGGGAVSVYLNDGTTPPAGAVTSNGLYDFEYNSNYGGVMLLNPNPITPGYIVRQNAVKAATVSGCGTGTVVITMNVPLPGSGYYSYERINFQADATSISATYTVDIDGQGVVSLLNQDGTDIEANQILINGFYDIVNNGSNWILINPSNDIWTHGAGTLAAKGGGASVAAAGDYSLSYGNGANLATGNYTYVFGNANEAWVGSSYSLVGGQIMVANAAYCMMWGINCYSQGSYSTNLGNSCNTYADFAHAIGSLCDANGTHSWAMGNGAVANNAGSVVWGGSTSTPNPDTTTNQFNLTFANGFRFFTGTAAIRMTVDANGVTIPDQLRAITDWADTSGNILIKASYAASAVNYLLIGSNATGLPPVINANGSDTNIDLNLGGKGTGAVNILGASTNSNAPTGYVGEYISSQVVVASAVNLANNTATNITSISLTAGDWDVYGNVRVSYTNASTGCYAWISTTSATAPDQSLVSGPITLVGSAIAVFGICCLPIRISLAATTTVYLSATSVFTVGTSAGCGFIGARRVR